MLRNIGFIVVVAILVAAGGATAAQVITGAQIKNNSITGQDIKNKSLTPQDFKGSVRGPRGLTGAQGPQGVHGAQGAQGAPGANGAPGRNGVTDIQYVDGEPVEVPPLGIAFASVDCPAGTVVTGGSTGPDSEVTVFTITDIFLDNGFVVEAFNNDDVDPHFLQARAACATP